MPLIKSCPSCGGRMLPVGERMPLPQEIRHPRRRRCPHCGATLRLSLGYLLVVYLGAVVTAAGALLLLGLTVDLLPDSYMLRAFLLAGAGIGLMFLAVARIELEVDPEAS